MLDEADRMLDMGFIHDIRRIIEAAAREAAEPAVLGDHHARHPLARRRASCVNPRPGRGHAAEQHGRARHAARVPRPQGPQARTCSSHLCRERRERRRPLAPGARLHAHQARREPAVRAARAAPASAPRHPRQQVASRARRARSRTSRAGKLTRARRDRHRLARHRRRRACSHVINFDLPNVARGLRAPIGRTAAPATTVTRCRWFRRMRRPAARHRTDDAPVGAVFADAGVRAQGTGADSASRRALGASSSHRTGSSCSRRPAVPAPPSLRLGARPLVHPARIVGEDAVVILGRPRLRDRRRHGRRADPSGSRP